MTINERKLRKIIRSVLRESLQNPLEFQEDLYILIDDYEQKLSSLKSINVALAVLCRNSKYKYAGIQQFANDLRSENKDLLRCLESAIQDESRMDDFYKKYKATMR